MNKKEYLVLIEKGNGGYGAFSPDIPGCVAVASTISEVRKLMKKAVTAHLKSIKKEGKRLPVAKTKAEYIRIAA